MHQKTTLSKSENLYIIIPNDHNKIEIIINKKDLLIKDFGFLKKTNKPKSKFNKLTIIIKIFIISIELFQNRSTKASKFSSSKT